MSRPSKAVQDELSERQQVRMVAVQEEQRQRLACSNRRADLARLLDESNHFACARPLEIGHYIDGTCGTCDHLMGRHQPSGAPCLDCLTEITAVQALDIDP